MGGETAPRKKRDGDPQAVDSVSVDALGRRCTQNIGQLIKSESLILAQSER